MPSATASVTRRSRTFSTLSGTMKTSLAMRPRLKIDVDADRVRSPGTVEADHHRDAVVVGWVELHHGRRRLLVAGKSGPRWLGDTGGDEAIGGTRRR